MNLGQKIKQLRNERNLSLEKLAQNLTIAKSILWKYEKGQTVPSADIIKRIAAFFNVSTDYLLFETTEKDNITRITDRGLLRQFEEVDKMDAEDKDYIMKTIELVINKNKIKKMVS
ncbi:MAG TPA: helix-turn-helix transcriptional regulator [Spirochaetota bacterium]|nr:helix-turn-helix transcriptional regulator [Smithellaceae bacterium]HPL18451.1 helix-turn-helix transcriptional regulator [Spirochaetota bacterium]